MPNLFIVVLVIAMIIMIGNFIFMLSRYRRCAPDQVLVIYGKTKTGDVECICGGGRFVWPIIQDSAYLSLRPMTIKIKLKGITIDEKRIDVPGTFTFGVSSKPEVLQNAAKHLLGLDDEHIKAMAKKIIFSQLRLTVASLTEEQIKEDQELFLNSVSKHTEPEFEKIGLNLINTDFYELW